MNLAKTIDTKLNLAQSNRTMLKIIISWLFSFLSIKALSFLVPQIIVGDFLLFGVFLLVFALINFFLRPILQFLTFPLTVLTLGLFAGIVNFFCLWVALDLTQVIQINASGVFWLVCMILISTALSWSSQLADRFLN